MISRAGLLWGCAGLVAVFACACGKPKPEPLIPVEVTDFNELYTENCAGCHGAGGKNGAAQPLNDALYLALIPKQILRQVTENGMAGSLMPGFSERSGGGLTKNQIDILVSGIEKWANPDEAQITDLPAYAAATKGDAKTGIQVFQTACASCHGTSGKAGPLTDVSFLELATDQSLRTTVIAGRPELGMPDWKHDTPQHALTGTEIDNVVAYLSSQRRGGMASDQPSTPEGSPRENK
jgi:mono/diheme cytochrome c family protein